MASLLYVTCNFVSLHVTKVVIKNCHGQEENIPEISSHSVSAVADPVCTNGGILTGKFCNYIKSLFLKSASPIPPNVEGERKASLDIHANSIGSRKHEARRINQ